MSHCLDYDKTRLGPYIVAAAVETEERIARLHVVIGILGCVFSVYLVTGRMLPLVMSGGLYLGILFFFLIYATVYLVWKPYRRYRLPMVAGIITLLDLGIATVIVVNTGGLVSTFWGLWAAAALSYVIRFRYGLREGMVTAILFLGTVELVRSSVPVTVMPPTGIFVGLGFSLFGILGIGRILVNSERRAIRNGMTTECETIHRIVNTVQHEVNNPLAVASGNLQLLRRSITAEEYHAWVEKIEEALIRISAAVERLRELEEDRVVAGDGITERYSVEQE